MSDPTKCSSRQQYTLSADDMALLKRLDNQGYLDEEVLRSLPIDDLLKSGDASQIEDLFICHMRQQLWKATHRSDPPSSPPKVAARGRTRTRPGPCTNGKCPVDQHEKHQPTQIQKSVQSPSTNTTAFKEESSEARDQQTEQDSTSLHENRQQPVPRTPSASIWGDLSFADGSGGKQMGKTESLTKKYRERSLSPQHLVKIVSAMEAHLAPWFDSIMGSLSELQMNQKASLRESEDVQLSSANLKQVVDAVESHFAPRFDAIQESISNIQSTFALLQASLSPTPKQPTQSQPTMPQEIITTIDGRLPNKPTASWESTLSRSIAAANSPLPSPARVRPAVSKDEPDETRSRPVVVDTPRGNATSRDDPCPPKQPAGPTLPHKVIPEVMRIRSEETSPDDEHASNSAAKAARSHCLQTAPDHSNLALNPDKVGRREEDESKEQISEQVGTEAPVTSNESSLQISIRLESAKEHEDDQQPKKEGTTLHTHRVSMAKNDTKVTDVGHGDKIDQKPFQQKALMRAKQYVDPFVKPAFDMKEPTNPESKKIIFRAKKMMHKNTRRARFKVSSSSSTSQSPRNTAADVSDGCNSIEQVFQQFDECKVETSEAFPEFEQGALSNRIQNNSKSERLPPSGECKSTEQSAIKQDREAPRLPGDSSEPCQLIDAKSVQVESPHESTSEDERKKETASIRVEPFASVPPQPARKRTTHNLSNTDIMKNQYKPGQSDAQRDEAPGVLSAKETKRVEVPTSPKSKPTIDWKQGCEKTFEIDSDMKSVPSGLSSHPSDEEDELMALYLSAANILNKDRTAEKNIKKAEVFEPMLTQKQAVAVLTAFLERARKSSVDNLSSSKKEIPIVANHFSSASDSDRETQTGARSIAQVTEVVRADEEVSSLDGGAPSNPIASEVALSVEVHSSKFHPVQGTNQDERPSFDEGRDDNLNEVISEEGNDEDNIFFCLSMPLGLESPRHVYRSLSFPTSDFFLSKGIEHSEEMPSSQSRRTNRLQQLSQCTNSSEIKSQDSELHPSPKSMNKRSADRPSEMVATIPQEPHVSSPCTSIVSCPDSFHHASPTHGEDGPMSPVDSDSLSHPNTMCCSPSSPLHAFEAYEDSKVSTIEEKLLEKETETASPKAKQAQSTSLDGSVVWTNPNFAQKEAATSKTTNKPYMPNLGGYPHNNPAFAIIAQKIAEAEAALKAELVRDNAKKRNKVAFEDVENENVERKNMEICIPNSIPAHQSIPRNHFLRPKSPGPTTTILTDNDNLYIELVHVGSAALFDHPSSPATSFLSGETSLFSEEDGANNKEQQLEEETPALKSETSKQEKSSYLERFRSRHNKIEDSAVTPPEFIVSTRKSCMPVKPALKKKDKGTPRSPERSNSSGIGLVNIDDLDHYENTEQDTAQIFEIVQRYYHYQTRYGAGKPEHFEVPLEKRLEQPVDQLLSWTMVAFEEIEKDFLTSFHENAMEPESNSEREEEEEEDEDVVTVKEEMEAVAAQAGGEREDEFEEDEEHDGHDGHDDHDDEEEEEKEEKNKRLTMDPLVRLGIFSMGALSSATSSEYDTSDSSLSTDDEDDNSSMSHGGTI
jgi:hypothetical protein